HYARSEEVAELLILKGADVSARDNEQKTPLHCVAATGRTEVAKILIRRGADVNVRDSLQRTPATTAEKNNHPDLASVIRKQGVGGSRWSRAAIRA
ncbi:MAG: ankyrin repeat domain-containing protein, partial [Syntrophorhabdales bacterium]